MRFFATSLFVLFLAIAATPSFAQSAPQLALSKGIPEFTRSLEIDPTGQIVLTASSRGLGFFAAETGELIQERAMADLVGAAFDHTGTVYTFGADTVSIFNHRDLATEKTISIPALSAYAFNTDRTVIYVAGDRLGKSTIWEIDPANQRARVKYAATEADPIVHLSLAGDFAFIRLKSGSGQLLKTGTRWASAKIFPAASDLLGLLPNGQLLQSVATSGRLQTLRWIDPITGSVGGEVGVPNLFAAAITARLPARLSEPLLVVTTNAVLVIDVPSAQLRPLVQADSDTYHGVAYDPASQRFWVHHRDLTGARPTIDIHRADTAALAVRWTNNAYRPIAIWGHPTENRLLVRDDQGRFKALTFEPARLAIRSLPVPDLRQDAVSSDGRTLAIGREDRVDVLDPFTLTAKRRIGAPSSDPSQALRHLAISHDATFTLRRDDRQLVMLDATGQTLWTRPNGPLTPRTLPFLSGRSGRVYMLAEATDAPALTALDARTGQPLWTSDRRFRHIIVNEKQNEILLIRAPARQELGGGGKDSYYRSELTWLDAATGRVLRGDTTTLLDPETTVHPNADGQLLALLDADRIRVLDTLSLLPLAELTVNGPAISAPVFFGQNHYLAALATDGTVRLFDLLAQRSLAQVQLLQDDQDWLVTDALGRFDAPVPTQQKLNFAINLSLVPLTAYFDAYFRPRLLDDLLQRREIAPPALDFAALAAPPAVRLTALDASQAVLTADATVSRPDLILNLAGAAPATAPILEFRIFQNGKRVATSTRGLVVEDDDPTDAGADPSFNLNRQVPVRLLPGPNAFTAIAVNAQGIESVPTRLTLRFDAPPGQRTTLHVLAIGVNEYANESYNLNYAVSDATAFEASLTAVAAPLFDAVKPVFLSNAEVTRPRIEAALAAIAATAAPQDVFIFYYAGHGVTTQSGAGEFYLVPADVTQLYGADDQLARRGLSSAQLRDLSQTIPAQKQLFILDACQSAGALTALTQRGAAEEKAIAQLARSTGTHWLTASGSQQFAAEFAELGHGAFTYTLLQALAGKADTGDGRVTVNELKAYLESTVPEVTAQHKGTAQYPASYGFGQDFPIALSNR